MTASQIYAAIALAIHLSVFFTSPKKHASRFNLALMWL